MKKIDILMVILIIAIIVLGYRVINEKNKENKLPVDEPIVIDENPSNIPLENNGKMIYQNIYLKFENDKNIINSSSDGNYVIFTLNGENSSNKILYYEIKLNYENNNDSDYNNLLNIKLMELDDNNEVKKNIDIERYNTINDRIIYIDEISPSSNVNKKYKLQILSDNNLYNNILVDVNISLEKSKLPQKGKDLVLNTIKNSPSIVWQDIDNISYFTGSNINNNYVWYSGKLWRITALNPDGTMKLITDNIMTTIAWGRNTEYNASWVYQWLNEDFYDTLYNPHNLILMDANWNYTTDSNTIPVRPDSLPNQKVVKAPVGLLSSYEYYNAYRNSDRSTNYLNLNHYWWHITPQNNNAVRSTNNEGKQDLYNRDPGNYERGIRPVIYLNSYVEFTGSGTKTDPYKIIGDIKNGNVNDYLNTRISGEYLLFDNAVYRIIDIFDNRTKIMRVDYLRDGNIKIEKHIARTIVYGSPNNTQKSEWWDYYLINIWYPSISNPYRNMIVDGTYYLGNYPDYTHYKNTICIDKDLNAVTVKNCNKYNDSNHVYVGKVGLSRIGEMFAAQQLEYESYPPSLWTLTPYDALENRIVHESNTLWRHKTYGGFHVVHPTLYLKENVKITGGNGTFLNPYTISE